ncbi:Fatty acid synthase subunit alpha 2 [Colletotrichum chlorophyti]|uniref:Fatty acid synthase subunit alpha 2 n=1 Tax=Colletotrichum chlorophyti TaxID=708187 RepID=A0A1Q8RV57_9PEZI|nr:Fatty acid synthase subunit alpha 2 [Colletotrichum chlorophyti]
MSRPTASSRSGFVEAQGCVVQVLTPAELALEMGLPIFGVVAYPSMQPTKQADRFLRPAKEF